MSQYSVNHQHEYEGGIPCSKKHNIGGFWCLKRLIGNGAIKCNYRIPHTSVEGTYNTQKSALGSYGNVAFFNGKMCLNISIS
jgi:hypothetical protein